MMCSVTSSQARVADSQVAQKAKHWLDTARGEHHSGIEACADSHSNNQLGTSSQALSANVPLSTLFTLGVSKPSHGRFQELARSAKVTHGNHDRCNLKKTIKRVSGILIGLYLILNQLNIGFTMEIKASVNVENIMKIEVIGILNNVEESNSSISQARVADSQVAQKAKHWQYTDRGEHHCGIEACADSHSNNQLGTSSQAL